MATGRVPTTANSPLTAKGDLFGYSTAPARLAVGNNGETLVADSSTSTGLRYNPITGNQNFLVNGNLDIWQRGTSFANPATNAYTADRWATIYTVNQTTSRQTTGVPVGSTYCARFTYTGAGAIAMQCQALEASMAKMLAGKTVTVSVKVRRNASFASTLNLTIRKNATADTLSGGTWSDIATATASNAQLPTGTTSADWYTLTVTAAIPNDGTANGVSILLAESATGASGAYWEMAQFKLEIGSVATAMTLSGGTIQGELAAAQRYYQRFGGQSNYQTLGSAYNVSATTGKALVTLPVPMRVIPTSLDFNALMIQDSNDAICAINTLVLADAGIQVVRIVYLGTLTDNLPASLLTNNSTSAFVGFSAEL
jgi:hypothetical protein